MKIFQNIGLYKNYLPRLYHLWSNTASFEVMIQRLVADRFGGVHYLKPVLENDPDCFFTAGDSERLQKKWAVENGLPEGSSLEAILCAQIENHQTEVFYNMDPVRFDDHFLKGLPGCVQRTIAWRAAPSGKAQFLNHDLIVNNYPSLAKQYEALGARTGYFFPSHDPEMEKYAENNDRPIDILFIGGYSRHHLDRAASLEAVSKLKDQYNVVFNLDISRATKLAESPLGWVGPLKKLRRSESIRKISLPPVFGLEMYKQISQAKIVINGKVDIAGQDRGNMRVWETLGCGALLMTDQGNYPEPMTRDQFFSVYSDPVSLLKNITTLLSSSSDREALSRQGHQMIKTEYSKQIQWDRFLSLCE